MLGHESFDMTLQVYAHALVPGHQRLDIVERMATSMLLAPAPAAARPSE